MKNKLLEGKLVVSIEQAVAAPYCSVRLADAGARIIKVERKFRETRLYRTAPVSTNMILAFISHKVLGMPRSY